MSSEPIQRNGEDALPVHELVGGVAQAVGFGLPGDGQHLSEPPQIC